MKLSLFILVFLTIQSLSAQKIELKQTDTTTPVSGITYNRLVALNEPLIINKLEIDIKNPMLDVMAATAFDSVAGNQRMSQMFEKHKQNGHTVIAAINADFYEKGGYSTNSIISDGHVVYMPRKKYTTIGLDKSNTPFIAKINTQISLWKNGKAYKIQRINQARGIDELVLYNRYYGSSTRTNQWGSEVLLEPLSTVSVNDTMRFIVKEKKQDAGDMLLQKDQYVLSGHNRAGKIIARNFNPGDTLKIYIHIDSMPSALHDLVGGYTQLVTNGQNTALASYDLVGKKRDYFALKRHPRTAIGFNESKTRLIMVTIDGRQSESIGISLPQLADLMISFGAYNALNLDGGGSTTMVLNGEVVNSPSDKNGERAVSNGLLIRLKQ